MGHVPPSGDAVVAAVYDRRRLGSRRPPGDGALFSSSVILSLSKDQLSHYLMRRQATELCRQLRSQMEFGNERKSNGDRALARNLYLVFYRLTYDARNVFAFLLPKE